MRSVSVFAVWPVSSSARLPHAVNPRALAVSCVCWQLFAAAFLRNALVLAVYTCVGSATAHRHCVQNGSVQIASMLHPRLCTPPIFSEFSSLFRPSPNMLFVVSHLYTPTAKAIGFLFCRSFGLLKVCGPVNHRNQKVGRFAASSVAHGCVQ